MKNILIICLFISLCSCEVQQRTIVEKTATYEITFINGDKEDFVITSVDTGYKDEINGVYLTEGCVKYRVKDELGIGGYSHASKACNVRSFKVKL